MSRPPRPTSSSRLNCSGGDFDWEPSLRKLDELNARVEDPTLWNDAAAAQAISRERSKLAAQIEAVQSLERDLADAVGYAEMADEDGDEASLDEARAQLVALRRSVLKLTGEAPVRLQLLSAIRATANGEACVCDLTPVVGLSQPTVSHHLKVLADAGFLEREKRGTWAWFRLVPGALDAVTRPLAEPTPVLA